MRRDGLLRVVFIGGLVGLLFAGCGDEYNIENSNDNNQLDAATGDASGLQDGSTQPDAGQDGSASCNPATDPCCDPDGTPCDHGCDGTNCYPDCDPAQDSCCESDGTLCAHGCDGTDCYPDCDPAQDNCCESDGTVCAHGCDGTDCYPECNPTTDDCCNADGTLGALAHDPCALGGGLDPACDSCVQQACAFEPTCCSASWDFICIVALNAACPGTCPVVMPTCQEQYGTAPSYIDCSTTAAECEFQANVQSASCGTICTDRGGECLSVYNNSGTCGHDESLTCSTTGYNSVICICSRGCGGNLPCLSIQTCVSGVCS